MKQLRFALLAALVAALFVLVPAASADCPPGDLECALVPPESEQVNPDPGSGAGPVGEVGAPGSALPVQAVIPMPLPAVAEATLSETPVELAPSFSKLEIPLRYQQPGDVSCGVQALGMALDGLGGAAPTSSALLGFLQDNGMMYDFGTGVEELAYTAQSLGYGGSFSFHGATLDDLAAQLANGSPVVVSLGSNGEGEPGHFVTVTGISADRKWVSYNDPTLGRQAISAEEFARLWGLQGNSGVAVEAGSPSSAASGTTGLALLAGVAGAMALAGTWPGSASQGQTSKGPYAGSATATSLGAEGALAAVTTATASNAPSGRAGIGGSLALTSPDPGDGGEPPAENWVTVRVPYVENVVVGHVVVRRSLVEKRRWIPPRTETIRQGYRTTRTRTVAYTAYRPKSRLVQRVVNVARQVYEKVTTWVSRTIMKPVTRWVTRTRTWFERTWLGKLVRRVRTWLEPVVEWVRRTVVEPVTTWVKRTVIEPVTQWVEETFMEAYTAYRTEEEEVWIPPETRTIPGYWETYDAWEDVTEPVTEEVTRWRECVVDANALPADVAQAFFDRIDPHLSGADQLQLFHLFRDTFPAPLEGNANVAYAQALDAFFNFVDWWRGHVTCEGSGLPSEDMLTAFRANAPSGTLVDRLWVTDPIGMRFRVTPGGREHPYGLRYRTVLAWDGEVHWDASGRTWYHVGDGDLWGWVAGDGLAAYRPNEHGDPLDPLVETYGYGVPEGWKEYWTEEGAAQYLDLRRVMLNAGDADALSYPSMTYHNRCGELTVFEAMGVPLEAGFLEADRLFGDLIRQDGLTGAGHLIPLMEALGADADYMYVASAKALEDANAGNTVIAWVNVIGGSDLAPLEPEGKVIAHWVHVLSAQEAEQGVVALYNSLTNSVQYVSQDEFANDLYQGLVVTAEAAPGD